MKRIIALISALIIVSSLFSCADADTASKKSEEDTQKIEFTPISSDTADNPDISEPPADEPLKTASFVGCGDNIIYTGTWWAAQAYAVPGGRTYNFAPIYDGVSEVISGADLAYVNQETVMDSSLPLESYPQFNSPQDLGYDLCDVGFDIVNLANNHMLDHGGSALSNTIDFWKSLPVTMIGGNSDRAEFDNVEIIEKNGIKIALLAYCEMTNLSLGSDYSIWIPYLDEEDINAQCESVKDKCDLIICSVHWGEEGSFETSENQRHYAQVMADAGVDVIIGTHPHVLQPIEYLTGKNGNRTLCVYSLGNFMAMQAYDQNMIGGMITFDINKKGDNRAYIDNVLFVPTVYYFEKNWYGSRIYLLRDFTPELASSHGIGNYGNYTSVENLTYYVTSTISRQFLPEYIPE